MKRSAFTMMELVFVIVILGILASVAVPRLTATRTDAQITRGIADISAIRSSIITKRSENLLTGNASYPDLEGSDPDRIFDGVLDYPIMPAADGKQGWTNQGKDKYAFNVGDTDILFDYNKTTGIFACVNSNGADKNATAVKLCNQLTR